MSAPLSIRNVRLLPLEIVAIGSLGAAGLYVLLFSVPFYFPNGGSATFAINHYVVGAAIAIGIGLLSARIRGRGPDSQLPGIVDAIRNILAFALIVYLHFNFKLWAQLVNPRLFDDWYQWTDQLIAPLIQAAIYINVGFAPLRELMPHAYHDVFVFMFFSTFIVFSLHSKAYLYCGEVTTAIALILGIGGITYAFAPAWGPFVYSPSVDEIAALAQSDMGNFYRRFVDSNGTEYSGQYFISAIAAMPSLHSAHAIALWLYARRHIPWLGYVYLPALIFILTEAIAAKWHYVIDLLFGLAIAVLCMLIATKLHGRQAAENKKSSSVAVTSSI